MNDNGDDFFDGDDEFDVLRVHEEKEDGLELEPSIKRDRRRSDYIRDYRSRPEVIERARLKKQLGYKKLSSVCILFLAPIVKCDCIIKFTCIQSRMLTMRRIIYLPRKKSNK